MGREKAASRMFLVAQWIEHSRCTTAEDAGSIPAEETGSIPPRCVVTTAMVVAGP